MFTPKIFFNQGLVFVFVICYEIIFGLVAEWLRRGLQILVRRFDSGRGLHLGGWLYG